MHGVATPGEQGHEAQTQRAARAYVVALHGAVRAVRLYPVENSAVQKALLELLVCGKVEP